ncbi:hypothetical protein GV819_27715 [Pseudomonas sp. Fl5BN2]|uniref:putative metallopeptidase n=1 Tax=Pseudomonas sp. Fl5BN2 TaxID=2697652 RepID=UPI001376F1C6|nr:hypothetical protein [Pseudomonas sp. Fl5BN2]
MDRPSPPASLLELSDLSGFGIRLTPAPEVWEWLQAEILVDTGSIHNEDHAHLKLQSHDVEEFVGVVRRYGASPDVQALVDAANNPAEVGKLNISRACGTCLLKSA